MRAIDRKVLFLWLVLFACAPIVLFMESIVSNNWVSYNLLPGTQLRYADDDDPEYIREAQFLLSHNWTGILKIGLWKYSLQENINGTLLDERSHDISSCYAEMSHHRLCPSLLLVRSLIVTAPILSAITAYAVYSVIKVHGLQRCNSVLFAFVPISTAFIGWIVFRSTWGTDLSSASHFLPLIPTSTSLVWNIREMWGPSQVFFMAAIACQAFATIAYVLLTLIRSPAEEIEPEAGRLLHDVG
jgi:hypothetical protein